MRTTTLSGMLAATLLLAGSAAAATPGVRKATDWLGNAVVTSDGQDVGTVRDLAIDADTGRVRYLVVSVGSFLIENNLIAVAPDALVPAPGRDGRLLLEADAETLRLARRFAADGMWPERADVQRGAGTAPSQPVAAATGAADESPLPPVSGSALIESRTRTARLSASERVITETPASPALPVAAPSAAPSAAPIGTPPTPRAEPKTAFDRLDRDGDGVLNRSEFAHEMTRGDHYSHVDIDANGVIDRGEYEIFLRGRDAARPAQDSEVQPPKS